MKSAEDLIDLILVLMIGVCIFVFVFPIEFPDGLFGKKNPQDNSQGIGPGAPFKITPAPASASNSWWQWLSYLFTMPEGYMGHDQVAAALKQHPDTVAVLAYTSDECLRPLCAI